MRRTSDRRRARPQGQAVPTLPWLGSRPADTTIHVVVTDLAITPDLTLPLDYAHRHGLVTFWDIARATEAEVHQVRRWSRHQYWPPRRARAFPNHANLYDVREVRQWLVWAWEDRPHLIGRDVALRRRLDELREEWGL